MLNLGVSRILGVMGFIEQDLRPYAFDLRLSPLLQMGKERFPSPTTPEILPL